MCVYRWLVTVGSEAQANALVYRCVNINGERTKCYLYDKLMAEEYQKYKTKYKVKDEDDEDREAEQNEENSVLSILTS